MDKHRNPTVRTVIYIKDVMRITGKKLTAARSLYYIILATFNKVPGQFLTVREFCMYTGVTTEEVYPYLKN